MWTIAGDLSAALITKTQPPRHDRTAPANPIWNSYPTRDGRFVLLVHPEPEPFWPRFCAAIGEPGWASDPRYDTAAKRTRRDARADRRRSARASRGTTSRTGRARSTSTS